MKKRIILALSFVLLGSFFIKRSTTVESKSPFTVRKIASEKQPTPKSSDVKPAGSKKAIAFSKKNPFDKPEKSIRSRVSPRIVEDFQREPSINLTPGHVFISNVGAVAKENYQSSMGEIIYQDGVFNFVRASGDKNFLPVAYSPSTGKLHPISSVLHVLNATEEVRSEVKGLGLAEYYYHPGTKFLSLKSSQSEVLQVYSDLKDRGFEVQLEVVKPHQRSI